MGRSGAEHRDGEEQKHATRLHRLHEPVCLPFEGNAFTESMLVPHLFRHQGWAPFQD
jgi:hypothetical protein